MDKFNDIARKYRQATWRTQLQWLALILLGVVIVAVVASVYLNVTARASAAGQEIMNLQNDIESTTRDNNMLKAQLAQKKSYAVMRQRAEDLGYEPAGPDDVVYVVVPGYVEETDPFVTTIDEPPPASIILPEYKETLFDWLADQIQSPTQVAGAQP